MHETCPVLYWVKCFGYLELQSHSCLSPCTPGCLQTYISMHLNSELKFLIVYLFIWLQHLSCVIWDLVSWPGIKPGSPALGAQSLSYWTTREILKCLIVKDEMGENNYWKHIYLSMYFTQESSEICSHQKLTGLEPGKENFQRAYYYCFVFCLMYWVALSM